MESTNSFLRTVLARVRFLLDDPDVDAKYSDDYIVRHCITPAMVDVVSRINNTSQAQVLLKFDITLVDGTTSYKLPPCVHEVLRVVVLNEDDLEVLQDLLPRDRMDYRGKNWSLEGFPGSLTLKTGNVIANTESIQVWYISNGDVMPHAGTGTLDADLETFTLASSPSLGALDRRPNSYTGQVLRLIPATGAIEERLIATHEKDGSDWVITVDPPFTENTNGSILYEVAPVGSQPLIQAIAVWASMQVGTARKITESHMGRLRTMYIQALKTIGDNMTAMQSRVPHHFVKATVDNPYVNSRGWNV